jgi:hypothetical protein
MLILTVNILNLVTQHPKLITLGAQGSTVSLASASTAKKTQSVPVITVSRASAHTSQRT